LPTLPSRHRQCATGQLCTSRSSKEWQQAEAAAQWQQVTSATHGSSNLHLVLCGPFPNHLAPPTTDETTQKNKKIVNAPVSQMTTSTSLRCFASLQAAASTPPGRPPSLNVPICAPQRLAHAASCSAAAALKVSPGASSTCRVTHTYSSRNVMFGFELLL
jgi:hypothetical protein